MSASSTPKLLKTIGEFGGVSLDGSNAPDILRNDKQNWDDILGANKPEDGATVGALPSEITALARNALTTMHSGGFGDISFVKNKQAGDVPNDGEIRVLGSVFYHPDGTKRTLPSADSHINTAFEAGTLEGLFYVIYTDTNFTTRFPTSNTPGTALKFFIAEYDVLENKWYHLGNSGSGADRIYFVPEATDCIVAVGFRDSSTQGITTLSTLIGVNKNLPADGADVTADSQAFQDLASIVEANQDGLTASSSDVTFLKNTIGKGNIDTDPSHRWGFDAGVEGWSSNANGSATWSNGFLETTNSASDGYLMSPSGLAVDGNKYNKLYAHVTLVSGSYSAWEGSVYNQNANHSWNGSYKAAVADPEFKVGQSKILEWDLSTISDWTSAVTNRLRIDIVQDTGSVWHISWIAVAREDFMVSNEAFESLTSSVSANATSISNEATKITQLAGDIGITNLGTGHTPRAQTLLQDIATIESNVTDTGNATSHVNRIGNMEAVLDNGSGGLLSAGSVNAIKLAVEDTETGLAASADRLDALELTVNNPTDGVSANASAIDTIQLAITDTDTGLTASANKISQLGVELSFAQEDLQNHIASMGALSPRFADKAGRIDFGVFENKTEIYVNNAPLAPMCRVDKRFSGDTVPLNSDKGAGKKYTFTSDYAGTAYLYAKLLDAEGNILVDINNTTLSPNPTGADGALIWFSWPINVIVGTNEIEIYNPSALPDDGATVYGIIVSQGSGDPEYMLEHNTNQFMEGDIGAIKVNGGETLESNRPVVMNYVEGRPVSPTCLAGYNFVAYANRNAPITFYVSAPFDEAIVEYTSAGSSWASIDGTITVAPGATQSFSFATTGTYRIRSSKPILVSQIDNTGGDAALVPPASSEVLCQTDGLVTERFDDRGTNITGKVGGKGYSYSNDGALLAMYRIGDGAGGDMMYGLPKAALGDTYMIPNRVGNFQITAIEPCVVRAYLSDGTLFGTYDFTAANRGNPMKHEEGSTGAANTGQVDTNFMKFVGTAPFFLSSNDAIDQEYPAIGYNSKMRSSLGLSNDSISNAISAEVAAGVTELAQALTNNSGASVSTVKTLFASYGSVKSFVENKATATVDSSGNAVADYVVRVNANGIIAGMGVSANGTTGATEIVMQADKFALVSSSHSGTVTAADIPFVVYATAQGTPGTLGYIPAGTYIKKAFIASADIMDLVAGKITADHIDSITFTTQNFNAGSVLTVGSGDNSVTLSGSDADYRIWAGNATAATAPFRVGKDGSVTMTNAVVTGTVNGIDGKFEGFVDAFNVTSELVNVTNSLTTLNRGDYRVNISGIQNTDPFSVVNVTSGEVIMGVNSSGKASFTGTLSAGVINDLAMFSQEVLDYIAPPVAGTTGGTAAAATPMGHTNNTYLQTLSIPQANTNPSSISFQFKDGGSYWDSPSNLNLSTPTYQVTVQRRVNGGAWTTLSGWSAKSYTGSSYNFMDGEKGSPDFGRWSGSFSIDINETITDNAHNVVEGQSLEYQVKFNRTTGSVSSTTPVKSYRISQATAGGGQAGVASSLTAPYIGLDTTGNANYPRIVPTNNPAAESVWLRVNATNGGILPYSNNGSYIGTDTWRFAHIHATNFYEAGVALSSKYFPISGGTITGSLVLSKNGGFDNLQVGDDVWLGDGNSANTLFIRGQQNADRGFITFGNNKTYPQLGSVAGGALTWGGNTVWNSGNDGAGSGLDADTVDGIQASAIVYGNTLTAAYQLTGQTTYNPDRSYFIDYNGSDTAGGNTTWLWGFHAEHGNQNGYGLSIVRDQSKTGLYHRNKDGNTWGAWRKIWTEDNDGASSGLDADMLDGIHASGFTRLNTTSPTFGYTYCRRNDATNAVLYCNQRGAGDIARFFVGSTDSATSGTAQVTIQNDGTLIASGNIAAFSDIRIKDNIEEISDAVTKILEIRGVTFNRTDLKNKMRQAGVIAQEVQKVLPEVVTERKDKKLGTLLTVNYGALTSLLIQAIKEQQAQIKAMQSDIDMIKRYLKLKD